MDGVRVYACTWGGASIDFGGGALHYFHRFIYHERRNEEREERERRRGKGGEGVVCTSFGVCIDVDVEGEGRLVSLRDSPSCRAQLRGRGRIPAYRDAFRVQWWLICGLYQTRFDLVVVVVCYLHCQVLLERVLFRDRRSSRIDSNWSLRIQVLLSHSPYILG